MSTGDLRDLWSGIFRVVEDLCVREEDFYPLNKVFSAFGLQATVDVDLSLQIIVQNRFFFQKSRSCGTVNVM